MKTWFTSDTHFGHANIIKYCNRPFKSIERMNEVLIKNWNSRIKTNGIVIFLGDFAFKDSSRINEYLDQLNGHITFIRGNHDNNNSLGTRIHNLVIEFPKYTDVYCVHDPSEFSSSYTVNLVGHVHEKWKYHKVYNTYLINIGVDVWKYYPISIEEILQFLARIKKEEKLRKLIKK